MKRITVAVLAALLMLTLSVPGVTPVAYAQGTPLDMQHYNNFDLGYKWCGPCSAVSIGRYYDKTYSYLPGASTNYDAMYASLHTYMNTGFTGYTNPTAYGPGFVEMALHYGYDNFSYDLRKPASVYEGWSIVTSAIDSGYPVALLTECLWGFLYVPALDGSDAGTHTSTWPCTKPHAIAIRGYYTDYWDGHTTHARVIRCTDSYAGHNDLLLDWGNVYSELTTSLSLIIIKNVDDVYPDNPDLVEDFNWGDDGDSLVDWQAHHGEVDWEVTTSSSSRAEIDDDVWHPGTDPTDTRSARFYRYSYYVTRGCYSLLQPSYISFYVKKEDAAYALFINGDGTHVIDVQFNNLEEIRYYTGSAYVEISHWQTIYPDNWYHIEFRSIDWANGNYAIYVYDANETLIGYAWATMRHGSGYAKNLYFEGTGGSGTFWIDDIKDSLRPS